MADDKAQKEAQKQLEEQMKRALRKLKQEADAQKIERARREQGQAPKKH